MEVSMLEVKSELQLPAYTSATATLDVSHICDLHGSFRQCWILNPLSKAKDWTCIFIDTMSGSEPSKPQRELQETISKLCLYHPVYIKLFLF